MESTHPCLSCGACCAFFRVEFYWREAEAGDHGAAVPPGLWEEGDDRKRCMKGTTLKHRPKCVALNGRIGDRVGCSIYANRPTPCRDFQASYEEGRANPRCDQARAKHGLAPLRPEDWAVWLSQLKKTLETPVINGSSGAR